MDRKRTNSKSDEEILAELREAAKHFGYVKFTRHEFDRISKNCKGTLVLSRFGTWENALKKTGIDLANRERKVTKFISDQELMVEMTRILEMVGQRPSKIEWENSNPKYSYTTYKTRFGGWVNAWKYYYTEYLKDSLPKMEGVAVISDSPTKVERERIRDIPLKLRLRVLKRDNYKCVFCGASPAIDPGVHLQVDHINPFSKGGKTELENLQTLCQRCNWGKSDEI
jgi:hypothetical protein